MAATTPAKAPVPPKRWFLRLPVILLLVGIGIGQVLLALVFLRNVPEDEAAATSDPAAATAASHEEPAHDDAHAKAAHAESPAHPPVASDPHDAHAAHGEHGEHGVETEVDLGNFALTIPPNKQHSTLLVTFHIYGTIDEHNAHEFEERHGVYRHRIRQEVLTLLRQSDLEMLGDPDFGRLKKQMLERINRVLQTAALSDLIFSEFAILEH